MTQPSLQTIVMCAVLLNSNAHGTCRLVNKTVKRHKSHPCTVTTYRGEVREFSHQIRVTIEAQELTCGRLKLGNWTRMVKDAKQVCWNHRDQQPAGALEMSQSFTPVSRWKHLVVVDEEVDGYTGGAHGYAYIIRRTHDVNKGTALTLADCFPDHHKQISKRARQLFDAKNKEEAYQFEPKAFGVFLLSKSRKTIVRFRFPHAVEVVRGTTLDVEVTVPALPQAPVATGTEKKR